ncbi:hypothetical protein ZOSMA_47G00030 [Zostera marina]|uniref:Uncharacterized protein n=1 Tax=Zostera marina TaxID=29655 RepID=A0A0K9NZS4_ZOSMR|nr:hypothetical protein ZOSMA_47G00030 [Zostera marina]
MMLKTCSALGDLKLGVPLNGVPLAGLFLFLGGTICEEAFVGDGFSTSNRVVRSFRVSYKSLISVGSSSFFIIFEDDRERMEKIKGLVNEELGLLFGIYHLFELILGSEATGV